MRAQCVCTYVRVYMYIGGCKAAGWAHRHVSGSTTHWLQCNFQWTTAVTAASAPPVHYERATFGPIGSARPLLQTCQTRRINSAIKHREKSRETIARAPYVPMSNKLKGENDERWKFKMKIAFVTLHIARFYMYRASYISSHRRRFHPCWRHNMMQKLYQEESLMRLIKRFLSEQKSSTFKLEKREIYLWCFFFCANATVNNLTRCVRLQTRVNQFS